MSFLVVCDCVIQKQADYISATKMSFLEKYLSILELNNRKTSPQVGLL